MAVVGDCSRKRALPNYDSEAVAVAGYESEIWLTDMGERIRDGLLSHFLMR